MNKKHLAIFISIFVLDQATKLIVSSQMALHESIPVIENFFNITYVQNTGAAWSILEGNMLFFYVITIVALYAMSYYYKEYRHDAWTQLSLVVMMAGTVGNFIDRIRLQYVVDFLDFNLFGYPFPVFNVADIALTLGVASLLLNFVMEEVFNHGK